VEANTGHGWGDRGEGVLKIINSKSISGVIALLAHIDVYPLLLFILLLCHSLDGLVLTTGQSPRPGTQQQQLQATTEDGLLQLPLSTLSVVEMHYMICAT